MNKVNKSGVVTIYGCGGAGITITHQFERFANNPIVSGFAAVNPVYVDTSMSNLNSLEGGYRPDSVYVFDKVDGSGGIRKEHASTIAKSTLDILVKFKPTDLNIVISSGSGGSGSVIAPSLVSELLARKENVIVICIGTSDSINEIVNTVNTLKSYQNVASLRGKPVVMMFEENVKAVKLSDTNKKLYDNIVFLNALFSRQNTGLDSADLSNWLNYTMYTAVEPKLTTLTFSRGYLTDDEPGDPISVASLANKDVDTTPGKVVDYRCYGILPDDCDTMELTSALHFVIRDGIIPVIFSEFDEKKTELLMRQKSRPKATTFVDPNDRSEENGLIL